MPASPSPRKPTTLRAKLEGRPLVGFRRADACRGETKSRAVKGISKGETLAGITKPT